jgi:hypothetical protein
MTTVSAKSDFLQSDAKARGVTLGNPKLHTARKSAVEAVKSDAYARFSKRTSDKSQPNNPIDFKRQFCAVGTPLGLLLRKSPGLHTSMSRATTSCLMEFPGEFIQTILPRNFFGFLQPD